MVIFPLLQFLAGTGPFPEEYTQPSASFLSWLGWNRLGPLLYFRLQQTGGEESAHILYSFLKEEYRKSVLRSLQQEAVLRDVSTILKAENIRFLVIKGMALKHTVYPHPACKPMADIDILPEPGKEQTAWKMMQSSGFRQIHYSESGFVENLRHHLPALEKNGTVVELHKHILKPAAYGDFPAEELWTNPSLLKIGNQEYLTLSPEHFLFHMENHLKKHFDEGLVRLIWLTDMGFFLKANAASINFGKVHSLLHSEANKPGNASFITLAAKVFHINLQQEFDNQNFNTHFISHFLSKSYPVNAKSFFRARFYLKNLKGKELFRYCISKIFPSSSYLRYYFPSSGKTPVFLLYPFLYLKYLSRFARYFIFRIRSGFKSLINSLL
ncbi:MAG: nucleotidyltransferase family protein [Bacteroidales bacterium]|nr:nucleotidyltransferase family protein [Bacteroidales bacterium]